MNQIPEENQQALLSIIGTAVDEITSAVGSLSEGNSAEFLSLCQESMDNISWAAEMVDQPELMMAAKEMHEQLCTNTSSLTTEQGVEIVAWFK